MINSMIGMQTRLRPIEFSDAAILSKWKNDENTYMYLGGGYQPISPDQYSKWVADLINLTGNDRRFIIETIEGKTVGMIGLYGINWIHRTCEIGAYIGDIDARGKGIAAEACQILEEYASRYLNLRKITLKVVEDNVTAKRFWTKMGFSLVGTLKRERFIDGEILRLDDYGKVHRKIGGVPKSTSSFPVFVRRCMTCA